MKNKDFLTSSSNDFIDNLYDQYRKDPEALDESWRFFFDGFEYKSLGPQNSEAVAPDHLQKEIDVFRLIQSFRSRGHLLSDTNPIKPRKDRKAMIGLEFYNLEPEDMKKIFYCGGTLGLEKPTLENIWKHMFSVYCGKIGIEYTHSNNTEARRWVKDYFEKKLPSLEISIDKKKRILKKLNEANVFENFLQAKFIGQKRFSLEGGETAIVAMDAVINHGAELGVKEFVVGMAHRGRLNMLANIFGKTYEFLFKEFESNFEELHVGGGDVKYHKGFSSLQKTPGGKEVILKLMHNPSHLEAVAPVACGYARAQIDSQWKNKNEDIVPIIIHGDAAVAGQGVVYETLQMSELDAYKCGGAIHFIINNQIGFTTDFSDGRSSHYCTSVARTLEAPILHVNGDDPESVLKVMEFAIEYRQKFKSDIFVDMVCYRKHGHNEGDEPKYTQPHLYGLVAKHKNPRELYLESLLQKGSIENDLAHSMQEEYKKLLTDRFENIKQKELPALPKGPHQAWSTLEWATDKDFENSPETGVKKNILDHVLETITHTPTGFNVLKKAAKILEDRKTAYETDVLDWGTAELLAYGSLLAEGTSIRFSGQDVIRGTFSHRHAKVFDELTNQCYCGLDQVNDKAFFRIYNSLLSEYAVLGFEYGYSLASPHTLNIWEAQFGDFANGAQIIIDQFIASGESKWKRMSNLVLLLPHGYEGQGPEHSSARLERFLELCGENNMLITNITSPANLFHALRRQQKFKFRKPLVVFSPKSLLRHPQCVSSKENLTHGKFQELIAPASMPKKPSRVIFCSGKIYYELEQKRIELKREDVAIVRLEQIYPFPLGQFSQILKKAGSAELYWVQEEPINMGAWPFLISRLHEEFSGFTVVAREVSSSPAVGSGKKHQRQQADVLEKSFSK